MKIEKKNGLYLVQAYIDNGGDVQYAMDFLNEKVDDRYVQSGSSKVLTQDNHGRNTMTAFRLMIALIDEVLDDTDLQGLKRELITMGLIKNAVNMIDQAWDITLAELSKNEEQ